MRWLKTNEAIRRKLHTSKFMFKLLLENRCALKFYFLVSQMFLRSALKVSGAIYYPNTFLLEEGKS